MEPKIRLSYIPTGKQSQFHRCAAQEALYGGAAGGGKTMALVMEALIRCIENPGMHAYLFRRTYRELEDTLISVAREHIPAGLGTYVDKRHEMSLKNGSLLRFRACQRDGDRFKYQGAEIHSLFIDELTHFPLEVYDYLKTRLRAPVWLSISPVVRASANPGGIGHAWVKRRFIDGGMPGQIRRAGSKTVCYIPATVKDNPHIGTGYIEELEAKPKALRDALLHGNWDAFEGQVFAEFMDDQAHYDDHRYTHVIAPFEIPNTFSIYRAFDFGFAKPFAALWFAVAPDGKAYLYREWYGCAPEPNVGIKLSPREIAREIVGIERSAGEKGVVGVADPSIWDASRGESIAQMMEEEGCYFLKGDNARLAGKMQLHYRLRFDEEGYAGLYVFNTCKSFIRTIRQLNYSSIRLEDVDTAGEDHIYDATRYFLMERPVAHRAKKRVRAEYNPLE